MNIYNTETTLKSMGYVETPEYCYREILQRRPTAMQGSCWLILFTKALGYFLIGSATISQVPQIFKILRRRNASGVSFLSMLLMLEASSSNVAYSLSKEYPINSWGENVVFMLQNVILVCLVLRYNKRPLASLSFMIFYLVIMILLILPVIPSDLILFINIISLPATSASRVIQIYTNHKNKSSGQLSAASTFLCVFHSCGRLTTSIVLTQDWIMILTFIQVIILNIILTGQVLYYRRSSKSK
ncbi:mannose-P-dolichol utilization defect 1 protein homolog [Mizuhopecten yessoensis]|uniref:mannose-P-dolichol utilization defect 1 protein homolog n=1 Tax=Mizuhopecten yessoensis TaxID=6573 RepID=UPI000B45F41B|nr:mannose-P-dolichol utilization defect 1 protein homolog [Mizuhopecten yessoensis]